MELYTQRTQTVYLDIHDAVRQTELRDTVFEYSTYLMQRFEHMHLISVLGSIACESQTRRTRTHNGNLQAFSIQL